LDDALRASRDYAEAIIATVREPLLILNKELRVVRANRAFYEFFKTLPEEIENQRVDEFGGGSMGQCQPSRTVRGNRFQNTSFNDFEIVKAFPQIGEKALLIQAHRLPSDEQRGDMILVLIDGITDRRALEDARRVESEHIIEEQASNIRGLVERDSLLKEADGHKNEFLAMLAHELRNPIAPIRTQVFSNLLNNASKYSLEGGEILLAARRLGDEAVTTLTDNDIGISTEVLPHIFEVFAQSDRAHPRSHGGLGLGLALSRRLVELHEGNITANSEGPGMESQFVVRLPVLPEAPTKAVESNIIGDRPIESARFRVLVVDDNVDSAEAIGRLLQLKGHDVRCAFNGASAITIARQFGAHLILLDISLPDIDGCEVLRRLREEPGASQPTSSCSALS
jgi:signal transduction histidine kinase